MEILLADDHALFRQGFDMIIKSTFPTSNIHHANNWKDTQAMPKQHHFDLALLDLFMPGEGNWEDELSKFVSHSSNLSTCIVSASTSQSHIQTAFNLGVRGFIQKTAEIIEIQEALRKLHRGKQYIPDSTWKPHRSSPSIGGVKITARQKEVLTLISEGRSNKEISLKLDMAESTVKRHAYNLFKLLNAKNRVDAVKIAQKKGILMF